MLPAPELPIYLDSTMVAVARSCLKKFYWNFILNKVPAGENIHFIAGGAFAAALDRVRQTQGASLIRLSNEDLLLDTFPTFIKHWGEFVAPESHQKNIYNVWYALEQYLIRYHPFDDPVKPLRLTGRVASEFSFAIPIPVTHPVTKERFLYCGKFDVLGDYGGRVTVMDDKTTGYFPPHWEKLWQMRGQFIGYVWATQQLGYDTRDCMVRGTAILKSGVDFRDCPITFTQTIIDRWYEELCLTAERISQHYIANYWPYDFADACSSYGGCPFMELCTSKEPENWLNNYQERTWSPISMEDLG
jgi:hypothetical protein